MLALGDLQVPPSDSTRPWTACPGRSGTRTSSIRPITGEIALSAQMRAGHYECGRSRVSHRPRLGRGSSYRQVVPCGKSDQETPLRLQCFAAELEAPISPAER